MNEKKSIKLGIIGICGLILISLFGVIFIICSKTQEISSNTSSVTNINEGVVITDNIVNLNSFTSNITIKEAGEYTLSGNMKYSLIIDSASDVVLNLNNIKIESSASAGVIVKNARSVLINLNKDTDNYISDGGSSSYNGAIYTRSDLTINGSGKLNITGNQGVGILAVDSNINIDGGKLLINSTTDGISTTNSIGKVNINKGIIYIESKESAINSIEETFINDGQIFLTSSSNTNPAINAIKGYYINGGTIASMGNGNIILPSSSSNQKVICLKFMGQINSDTLISLTNMNKNDIVTFKTINSFNNLTISSPQINNGSYILYENGKNTASLDFGFYPTGKYKPGNKIKTIRVSEKVSTYEI